jgi:hypothetical protein
VPQPGEWPDDVNAVLDNEPIHAVRFVASENGRHVRWSDCIWMTYVPEHNWVEFCSHDEAAIEPDR